MINSLISSCFDIERGPTVLLKLYFIDDNLCKKSWTKTKLAEAIITKTIDSKSSKKNSNKSPTRKSVKPRPSVVINVV